MDNYVKNIILTPMNILYKISPQITLKILYFINYGRKLNLKNPKLFSEKIQWIKLNDKNNLMPVCADKYEVRKYIKECGCENILNNLLWEGFNPNDIPFEELPQKFVIKVTHGQGFNIICKDKNKLDIPKTINKLNRWLKAKYLPCYGEWFYRVIKPRIIIEEFLDDGQNDSPTDYKVYCFHGRPFMISTHVNRFTTHKSNAFDIEWNVMEDISSKFMDHDLFIEKPKVLDQLLEYSRILSSKFIHVRVDFYIINSKIYFGEMTFTSGAGFNLFKPRSFDEKMGNLLNLKKADCE